MTRLLTFLAVAAAIPALAAPVPTHLMPKDQPVLFPTTVGTTWVYEVAGGEHTRVITDSKEKDGVTLVTSECRNARGDKFSQEVWSITPKGVFVVSSGDVTFDPPWCIFKYPYREGQSWSANQKTNGTVYHGTRKAGPMERIKVPAGELTAVRVDLEYDIGKGKTLNSVCWYAPGIGLVQQGQYKLKSFTPGKE